MSITAEEIQDYKAYKMYLEQKDPYEGSPNQIYKQMSSKRKGAAFEKIFEEFMINRGYSMRKNYNSDHDRVFVIDGKEVKIEIKGSTLWGEKGDSMKFQQIRVDQDYDIVVFMAVLPEGIEMYYAEKPDVRDFVDVQDSDGFYPYNQHGGKRVRSGTFAIQGLIKDFPFMKPIEELLNV